MRLTLPATKNGLYYQGDAWTRNDDNANINDQDVITLKKGVTGSANPTNAAAKWLFQGTYYLPERYIANASQQSRLAIGGSINGNIDNKYIIPLGHKQNESSTTELPTFLVAPTTRLSATSRVWETRPSTVM